MRSSARSFRDPSGRLHFLGSEPVRQVYSASAEACRSVVGGDFFQGLMQAGQVVRTRILKSVPEQLAAVVKPGELVLAHEAVPFPSFPAEWPFEMLKAAALLTLEIAEAGLDHGIGLKDATPYNILFEGTRPVFVDILSFENREPGDPVWLAQGQFMRTFLLPLLAAKVLQLPLAPLFLARREGLEPDQFYRMLSPLRRLRPSLLTTVSLPVWLSGRAEGSGNEIYRPRRLDNHDQSRFVLKTLVRRLRRKLERSPAPAPSRSTGWGDYCRTCSYDEQSFGEKSSFVASFLEGARPARVLDVGCNTGHFSRLAASHGARVVAIDQDAAVVGRLFSEAQREKLDILPLVVDFARPTPSTGWNNEETPSFLSRAHGHFDAVFMLALIHHLLVCDQIPLQEILALASRVTSRHLVIEYVSPDDPQFRRLVRGRDALYSHLTREHFERSAEQFFTIEKSSKVPNQERWLYVLEKRAVR